MSNHHDHEKHSHGHGHAHSVDITAANKKAFTIGIALNSAFVIAEVIAGFMSDSLALLTDAGHNASDVASLLLSLFAFGLAQKKASQKFTYGYKKTTVLAALTNSVLLLVAIGVLGYESITRLRHPEVVEGNIIAWIAAAGIAVNGISAFLFFRHKEKDLNVKSAYLHLLADALVSLGVVIGGVVISYTGWYWLDPVIGLGVMFVILFSTWSLLRDSFKMSIDAVPAGIDINEIKKVMQETDQVASVHHIHIWPLSTTENALTAHVVVAENIGAANSKKVIENIRHELLHYNIHHSTIELEYETAVCADDHCIIKK